MVHFMVYRRLDIHDSSIPTFLNSEKSGKIQRCGKHPSHRCKTRHDAQLDVLICVKIGDYDKQIHCISHQKSSIEEAEAIAIHRGLLD